MALLAANALAQLREENAAVQEAHPWIADAPPAFSRLIDTGQVQLGANDRILDEARKQALTIFRFDIDYSFRSQAQGTRYDAETDSRRTILTARVRLRRMDMTHRIWFRDRFRPSDPWETPLMKHEFDHVSISTDPRLIKMAKRVLESPYRCEVVWEQGSAPNESQISKEINAAVSARIAELERLVQANYDRLDQESRDGLANLENRSRFFLELYGTDWLKRCEFKYLDVVKPGAEDVLDKEVSKHYLFLETP